MAYTVDALKFPEEINSLDWLRPSIKEDLLSAWHDYDLMRVILQESVDVVSYHGKPSPAIDAVMQQCALGARTFENRLMGIQKCFRDPQSKFYSYEWLVGVVGHTQQKCGLEKFRESVLLLHNLVSSMRTTKQLDSVMSNFLGPSSPLDCSIDDCSVVQWYPRQQHKSINQDRNEVSRLEKPGGVQARPPPDTLANSNYTFDATITKATSSGITYIPARGLWDTGSNAFMISRQLLDRAKFTVDDMMIVNDIRIDGVGGAICKPGCSIELTWYVNRNMNSRQDMFYVHEQDAPFDILVPHNLMIGSRYTGIGKEGQTALVLQLRHKTKAEKEQEKIDEELALIQAGEKRKRRLDEAEEQRKILRKHRESTSSVTSSEGTSSS